MPLRQDPKSAFNNLQAHHLWGKSVYDHEGQSKLLEHIPPHQTNKANFESALANGELQPKPMNLSGNGSNKAVLDHPQSGKRYIVKPYLACTDEERPKYPDMGWGEMAGTALFHAAELGHIVHNVHVSNMPVHLNRLGGEVTNMPHIVITMEPNMAPISNLLNNGTNLVLPENPLHTYTLLHQINTIDSLTGNWDRHSLNLLYHPDTLDTQKHLKILAIDNDYSFSQTDRKVADIFHLSHSDTQKTFQRYLYRNSVPDNVIHNMISQSFMGQAEWWFKVKGNIQKTFQNLMGTVKDDHIRKYLEEHFNKRFAAVDRLNSMVYRNPLMYNELNDLPYKDPRLADLTVQFDKFQLHPDYAKLLKR
jgi:hypothetical protein